MTTTKYLKIKFPVWQFLKQPLFSSDITLVLNPHRFWHLYRIQLLERCWLQECDSQEASSS